MPSPRRSHKSNQFRRKAMRELPEVVNYTAFGCTVKALVFSGRDGEVSHLGKDGEPLLTLVILKTPPPNAPHKRPTVLQTATAVPEVEILNDVVHASHEFSADFKEKKGIQTAAEAASHRGHGEWSEVMILDGSLAKDEAPTVDGSLAKDEAPTVDGSLAKDEAPTA